MTSEWPIPSAIPQQGKAAKTDVWRDPVSSIATNVWLVHETRDTQRRMRKKKNNKKRTL
jgi:hypothetical protein